jgi:hypothetical protein
MNQKNLECGCIAGTNCVAPMQIETSAFLKLIALTTPTLILMNQENLAYPKLELFASNIPLMYDSKC